MTVFTSISLITERIEICRKGSGKALGILFGNLPGSFSSHSGRGDDVVVSKET